MIRAYEYVRGRFSERSTWVALVQGIGGAAAAPWPFNFMLLLGALVGAMIPDSAKPQP